MSDATARGSALTGFAVSTTLAVLPTSNASSAISARAGSSISGPSGGTSEGISELASEPANVGVAAAAGGVAGSPADAVISPGRAGCGAAVDGAIIGAELAAAPVEPRVETSVWRSTISAALRSGTPEAGETNCAASDASKKMPDFWTA